MARKSTFIKILSIIAAAAFISVVGTLSAEAAYKPGERAMKIWHDDLNVSKQAIFLKFKMLEGGGGEEGTTTMALKGSLMYLERHEPYEHHHGQRGEDHDDPDA